MINIVCKYKNVLLKIKNCRNRLKYLFNFSLIVKQGLFANVDKARICSWNKPVLSNEGKVSCSRKQREPLMGFELMTDRHPWIMSQMRYWQRHEASFYFKSPIHSCVQGNVTLNVLSVWTLSYKLDTERAFPQCELSYVEGGK